MDLRSARLSAGLSQAEAARALGVTVQSWSAWERGITRVPQRAWRLLGATPDGAGPVASPDTALAAARQQRGLSIVEAAAQLDIHPNAWSNWEHGRTPAPVEAYELVGLIAPDGARRLGERTRRVDGPRRRSAYHDRISADHRHRAERALKLREHGLRPDEIADRLGVGLEAVRRYLKEGA